MTDETEACMSIWDVPQSEIDRLARIMCEGDGANWDVSNFGETATGEDPESQRNYWRDTVCTILTDLAENPPQCAVEAMARSFNRPDHAKIQDIFTAAINAIRGEK